MENNEDLQNLFKQIEKTWKEEDGPEKCYAALLTTLVLTNDDEEHFDKDMNMFFDAMEKAVDSGVLTKDFVKRVIKQSFSMLSDYTGEEYGEKFTEGN